MARLIIALSGSPCSGKTSLSSELERRFDAERVSTHKLLLSSFKSAHLPTRSDLQDFGHNLDQQTQGRWIAENIAPQVSREEDDLVLVIDCVREIRQVRALREAFGHIVKHIHLQADSQDIESRFKDRIASKDFTEASNYSDILSHPVEQNESSLNRSADFKINTSRCRPRDVAVRAACYLGLYKTLVDPCVDVIVGGQYGSEGKGNIAFNIAPRYDLLIRTGGPNAGHKVPLDPPFTHRLLPSGTLSNHSAKLVLAAGSVLYVPLLLDEIRDCRVEVDRLAVDPQAMIITDKDKAAEEKQLVDEIGSTGSGAGYATSRRILREPQTKLARDIPELKPYIRDTHAILSEAYSKRQKILLEGTQGTFLSVFHGRYPHVTSRDTTVSGCLAEAGVPPRRVRRVIMVCRTYPIRVKNPTGKSSGHMSMEISWKEVARRSGLDAKDLKRCEIGSVSQKQRRVAEFDWDLLREAALLNGPTDIALTFVDYIDKNNQYARRFEQLSPDTIMFIEEVERVAGAPVTLISTRFHKRSIIDRGSW